MTTTVQSVLDWLATAPLEELRKHPLHPQNRPEKLWRYYPPHSWLPPICVKNYGQWIKRRIIDPGIVEVTSKTGDKLYLVKVILPVRVSTKTMYELLDLADKYGIGWVEASKMGNLIIMCDSEENARALAKELREKGYLVGGWGNRLWNIKICSTYITCTTAVIDAVTVEKALGDVLIEYTQKELPAKLTIKVSACPNACGGGFDAADIGIVGYPASVPMMEGWRIRILCPPRSLLEACPVGDIKILKDEKGRPVGAEIRGQTCMACGRCHDFCDAIIYDPAEIGVMVMIGGKCANTGVGPGMSRVIVPFIPAEPPRWPTLVAVIKKIVDVWIANAKKGERLRDLIVRIGWEKFLELTGFPRPEDYIKPLDKAPGWTRYGWQPLYLRRTDENKRYVGTRIDNDMMAISAAIFEDIIK